MRGWAQRPRCLTRRSRHAEKGFDRPGWLRHGAIRAGMITGWGAHHVDTAHWGMDNRAHRSRRIGARRSSPPRALGTCTAPSRPMAATQRRGDGPSPAILKNGIKWITKGLDLWSAATPEHTTASLTLGRTNPFPLRASDPENSRSVIGPSEWQIYTSDDQHGNWLDCIRSRKAPVATAKSAIAPVPPACCIGSP